MSSKSYAIGFCKAAASAGVNASELARFILKKADAGDVINAGIENLPEAAQNALRSIADYASEHPIAGGAGMGAVLPIASSAGSGTSSGAAIGQAVTSPLSVVTGPVGASAAASSGKPSQYGSAAGVAAPMIAGRSLGGSVGGTAGGIVGSAVSPVTAAVGGSAGSSAKGGGDFNKRVTAEKKRQALKEVSKGK